MKRAFWSVWIAVFCMSLVGYFLYPMLPAQVPSHWNMYGEVDAWQSPLQSVLFVPILTIVLGFVLLGMSRLDMRPSIQRAMAMTIIVMMAFFFVLHTAILLIGAGFTLSLPRIIIATIGLLFGALGQIMRGVEPNGFIGIRVYWTLANPVVWHESHQVAANAMALAAVVLVVLALLPISALWLFVGLLVVVLLAVVWPMIYAYRRFHQLTDGM
jgi:uncharacterized membrane protein